MSNQTDTITVVTADEAPAQKTLWQKVAYALNVRGMLNDWMTHQKAMAEAKRIADEKAAAEAKAEAERRAYQNALEVTANFALYGAQYPDKLNLLKGLLPVVTAEAAELANKADAARVAAEAALIAAEGAKVNALQADLEAAERERQALEIRLAARHAQVAETAENKIAEANTGLQTATHSADLALEQHAALNVAAAALNL